MIRVCTTTRIVFSLFLQIEIILSSLSPTVNLANKLTLYCLYEVSAYSCMYVFNLIIIIMPMVSYAVIITVILQWYWSCIGAVL